MARESRGLRWGPGFQRLSRFLGPPEERWETLLPLSIVVGLLSGLAAVGLRNSVHWLFEALAVYRHGVVAILLPAAGGLLGVTIVAHLFREEPGHGVPEVIRAVCRRGGRMGRRAIFSRWLGSMVNVSAGGSAGLEGPIVYSAAAIGSAVGGLFHVDERQRSVLLACGVAGGISGVFNAPMTGMIFAMEVVLTEWSALSIVPVVVAAVAGTELSRLLLGNRQSFLHAPFEMGTGDLVACLLLGVVAGLLSAALLRMVRVLGGVAWRLPQSRLVAPVCFGLVVGVIGMLAPDAIGEGYWAAQKAIRGQLEGGLLLLAGILLAKMLATGLTLGSGSPGGVFAPCLVIGALLGGSFARALRQLLPAWITLAPEGSFALVGMAGLVAGVMQAPLTGIFLVLEVTRGYEVILPLMIVSVLSLLVARRFDRYSIYTQELAEAGDLLRLGTDRRILADVAVSEALDDDVTPVSEEMSLASFVPIVKGSRRNHYPVLRAGSDTYVGMLELGAVRELLLDPELARLTLIGTVMDREAPTLPLSASLSEALECFEESGAWVLAVLDGPRFAGLLSKSTLFDRYRKELSVQVLV